MHVLAGSIYRASMGSAWPMSTSARHGRARDNRRTAWARILFACAGAVGLIAVAACGSTTTSSTRPAYCADRTNLQKSVKGLTSLNPSAGVSGLETQVNKVKTNANNLADATKSAFPSQSNALNSSITALQNSARSLASNPSAANIGTV